MYNCFDKHRYRGTQKTKPSSNFYEVKIDPRKFLVNQWDGVTQNLRHIVYRQ